MYGLVVIYIVGKSRLDGKYSELTSQPWLAEFMIISALVDRYK